MESMPASVAVAVQAVCRIHKHCESAKPWLHPASLISKLVTGLGEETIQHPVPWSLDCCSLPHSGHFRSMGLLQIVLYG